MEIITNAPPPIEEEEEEVPPPPYVILCRFLSDLSDRKSISVCQIQATPTRS